MKTVYEVRQGGYSRSGSFSEISSARDYAKWLVKNPTNQGTAQIVEVTRKVIEEVTR